MRKTFVLALLWCFAISYPTQAQNPPSWNQVYQLELDGQLQQAYLLTERIYLEAVAENNEKEQIRCFYYWARETQRKEEKANQIILDRLCRDIARMQPQSAAILHVLYAQLLHQIRYASTTFSTCTGELVTSEENKKIQTEHLLLALEKGHLLQTESLQNWNDLLVYDSFFHPETTVYDWISQTVRNEFKHTHQIRNSGSLLTEQLTSDLQPLLASSSEFTQAQFPTTLDTTLIRFLNGLQSYERSTLKIRPLKALNSELNRLQLAHAWRVIPTEQFEVQLHARLNNPHYANYVSKIQIELIKHWTANQHYPKYSLAKQWCDSIAQTSKDMRLLMQVNELNEKITQQMFNWQGETHWLPATPHRIRMDYRYTDSVEVALFRIPFSWTQSKNPFWKEANSYRNDSLYQAFTHRHTAVYRQSYALPKGTDFTAHSFEIAIPGLDTGHYLMALQAKNQNRQTNWVRSYQTIEISPLKQLFWPEKSGPAVLQMVNSKNGEPIKGVKIVNGTHQLITDPFGKAKWKPSYKVKTLNGSTNTSLVLYQNDTIAIAYRKPVSVPNVKKESKKYKADDYTDSESKILFFTDRAIYRPGHTIHFKGIVYENRKEKWQIVPHVTVAVILTDALGKTVWEKELTTNDMGSFSGSYTLPLDAETGEYDFEVDEPDDYANDKLYYNKRKNTHAFWDHTDLNYTNFTFAVEEYKRPTFEITLDTLSRNYAYREPIRMTGKARYLTGTAVVNAQVEYLLQANYTIGHNTRTVQLSGELTTDDSGQFTLIHPIDSEIAALDDLQHATLNLTVRVIDAQGELRESSITHRINPYAITEKWRSDNTNKSELDSSLQLDFYNTTHQLVSRKGTVDVYGVVEPNWLIERLDYPEFQSLPKQEFSVLFPHVAYSREEAQLYYVWLGQFPFESGQPLTALQNYLNQPYAQIQLFVCTTDLQGQPFELTKRLSTPHPAPQTSVIDVLAPTDQNPYWSTASVLETAHVMARRWIANQWVEDVYFVRTATQTNIPFHVPNRSDQPEQVQVLTVWQNKSWTAEKTIALPLPAKKLPIELTSMRLFIEPGSKELWQFKLPEKNSSEVLASMYDQSLDQFQSMNWLNQNLTNEEYVFPDKAQIEDPLAYRFSNYFYQSIYKWIIPQAFAKKYNTHISLNTYGFSLHNKQVEKQYLNSLSNRQQELGARQIYRGYVRDQEGALPAAEVAILNSNHSTMTDSDGYFEIEGRPGETLRVTYIGFIASTQVLTSSSTIDIQMELSELHLDEIEVTAFGNQKKEALTGAVAGVQMSEKPYDLSNKDIRIRGIGSLDDTKSVLYIVNGVPTHVPPNSNEIASVEIVKPDAAIALYGSRASEGAIIISTTNSAPHNPTSSPLNQVAARSNFQETAFFYPHLRTDEAGNIQVEFTAPDDLTRWKFRLFAHQKQGNLGYFEQLVTTQKKVMVQSNPPRFVRQNDQITLTATLSNLTTESLNGQTRLRITNPATQEKLVEPMVVSPSEFDVQLPANGQQKVSWRFAVPANWEDLQYEIVLAVDGHSDGEKRYVPVLSDQVIVTETVSEFVPPRATRTVALANLQQLQPDQHPLSYTLNVQTQPQWVAAQSLPYLIDYEFECSEQTAARYVAYHIAHHLLTQSPEWKNWVTKKAQLPDTSTIKAPQFGESPTQYSTNWAALADAKTLEKDLKKTWKKLQQMQQSNGSFAWFEGGEPDVYLTQHIVALLGKLHSRTDQPDAEWKEMTSKALGFLQQQHREKTRKAISATSEVTALQLHYFYARSYWKNEFPISVDERNWIHHQAQHRPQKWVTSSLYEKGLWALIFHAFDQKPIAENIAKHLHESQARSTEMGAYWIENTNGYYWYNSSIETHTLLMEVLQRIQPNTAFQHDLQVWLIRQKQLNHWPSTRSTAEAVLAIWQPTFANTEKVKPVELSIGENAQKTSWNNPPNEDVLVLDYQLSQEEINSQHGTVQLANPNPNAAYAQMSWTYETPLSALIQHGNQQLKIEKSAVVVKTLNAIEHVKPIQQTTVQVGDIVRIQLHVQALENLEYVHLTDHRASTYEPHDVLSRHQYSRGLRYYQSTRDAATHFFIARLPKGSYLLEYEVIATYPGQFQDGHAELLSLYAPQVNAHSSAEKVVVNAP